MSQFLRLRAKGHPVGEALRLARWSKPAYDKARKRYPEFAEAADAVRDRVRAQEPDPLSEHKPEPPDFATFRKEAFGHDTPPHHAEIIEHLEDRCGARNGRCTRLLVLVFPEAAKTTLVDLEFSAYLMAKESHAYATGKLKSDEVLRMAVMSQTTDYAKTIGWQLRTALTDRGAYPELHRYGPFRDLGTKWSERAIYMHWRSAEEKEPSVQWLGWENQIQGARLTHLILDDVDSPETGPNDRKKILRKLDHTLSRRLGATGKLIVLATRVDEADIYTELLDRADRGHWHVVMIPAQKADGEPTWPRPGFDREYYDLAREEMGNDQLYNLVFQQVQSLGSSATFTSETIERIKVHDLGLGVPFDDGVTIVGLDPADTGPYATHALSFSRSRQRVRTIGLIDGTEGGNEAMVAAVHWAIELRAGYLQIEKQGGLSMFMSKELEELCTRNGVTVNYVSTTAQGLSDTLYGTKAMAQWMSEGRWELPWGDPATIELCSVVTNQLAWYDPDNKRTPKDHVRAPWFAFRKVLELNGRRGNVLPFGRRTAQMPWLRQHQRQVAVGRGAVVPSREA